jgi:Lrp/AsnC family transcriptional regulator, leucine-responsive regulatory protein
MDDIDFKTTEVLMQQGRITWAELGTILGLSAPAAADRVRQLENRGVIRQFAALIDANQLGYGLIAFISVVLERPQHRAGFLERVQELPEIQECHHVAGEDDYWLKVRCLNTHHLDWLLSDQLKAIPGVIRTRTTIVLSTPKETCAVPLPQTSEYRPEE